ncbi:MAG: hypothetical protein IKF82_06005 [Bacilli bacterium]|nr:hypothetical protein [Bacilli bacterium]MBR3209801.1 hypothetical protein [Bacilli bacterium]
MKFRILKKSEVFGPNCLKMFENDNLRIAKTTDFASLCSYFSQSDGGYYYTGKAFFSDSWLIKQENSLSDMCSYFANCIDDKGDEASTAKANRRIGIRPTTSYSSISNLCFSKQVNEYGVKVVTFGEYPQSEVSVDLAETLDKQYNNHSLQTTGKFYTINGAKDVEADLYRFLDKRLIEYQYEGCKYVRFDYYYLDSYELPPRRKDYSTFWFKVEPITWLVDEEKDVAVSEKVLVSGLEPLFLISFDDRITNPTAEEYLNAYFSAEVMPFSDEFMASSKRNRMKFETYRLVKNSTSTVALLSVDVLLLKALPFIFVSLSPFLVLGTSLSAISPVTFPLRVKRILEDKPTVEKVLTK